MSTSLAFDLIARDRASDKFDKIGNSADRSSGKLKKWAKVGAVAMAAGTVVVAKGLFDMTKAAMADEKAQATLAKTLQNSAGATKGQIKQTEDYISKMGLMLGVTDDELRPALGRLAVATGDVQEAQSLAMIAMNVSAGTGKNLKTVTEALAKAQTGQMGGLSRLGVKVKDAEGKTRSLKDITAELASTYAGQASTAANTTEGKFGRLKLMFDETKESIGARLIPVALKLADWMFEFAPKVQSVGESLSKNLGPALQMVGGFIGDHVIPTLRELAGKWLTGVKGAFDNVSKSVKENKPFLEAVGAALAAVAKVAGGALKTAIGFLYEHGFPLLGTAIGKGITIARKLTTGFLFLGEYGTKSFRFLLEAAFATFDGILSAADKGLGWVPKLGDKIHDAKESFHDFRTDTIANLDKTANKLHDVRNKINGIKSPPPINIDVNTASADAKIRALQRKLLFGLSIKALDKQAAGAAPRASDATGSNARGTNFWRGGWSWVGEQGPELLNLPRGAQVKPARESARMAGGGMTEREFIRALVAALSNMQFVIRGGSNDGQLAYLQQGGPF